ncbi:hypothetical protein GWK47_000534 [Chionoecetes opilio]|uniref:Uncharacterized protein n=1 Tax=Chionoecetes opilio TaxID=41210 RepID=A0A8J4Y7U3_CHIOP|nr:hypothetical protein GWK47_000534 [Chionoecetes opilio]
MKATKTLIFCDKVEQQAFNNTLLDIADDIDLPHEQLRDEFGGLEPLTEWRRDSATPVCDSTNRATLAGMNTKTKTLLWLFDKFRPHLQCTRKHMDSLALESQQGTGSSSVTMGS